MVIDKILDLHATGKNYTEIAIEVFGVEWRRKTVAKILADAGETDGEHINQRILLISDLHIPFHHPDAFEFLRHLKKKYNPTRVISLGDECFPPEVEILTEDGFVRFDQLNTSTKVAQWNENKTIDFVVPQRHIKKHFTGKLIEYRQRNMVSRTTPKHNLVKIDRSGVVHRREAWDSYGNESWEIPTCGQYNGQGIGLSDDEIRLMVAFQADGTFTKGAARFHFTKERKISRLISLLQNTGIPYNEHKVGIGRQFYIEVENVPSYFTKIFNIPFYLYTNNQAMVFVKELEEWDGTKTPGGARYTSAFVENCEYVSVVSTLAGIRPGIIRPANGQKSCYYVDFRWNPEKLSLKSAERWDIDYDGFVYCVTVDSGMIVVRTDGNVHISGNCDQHALSYHEHDPNLPSPGFELERTKEHIKILHDMFPVMDILESNHGSLVYRKAKTAGIPREYLKSYNDVLGVGDGWKWHFDLTVQLPNGNHCYFHHGKVSDVVRLSQQMGMCAVQGHYHEKYRIDYWGNPNALNWGMSVGCLIDDDALAFSYNNVNVRRPVIGTGLIINSHPVLEPMILSPSGRWE